ncbi:asparagine synthase-related protein [Novosphingobium terrae]|uniref:asparagine synthase-related protein n=1 Tax=Novosphingobium terrae TaxID=2726189 RepID=UPI0019800544|nr:asparagine synthase C-terminal domain-containing protein [Novosphingobium terrae]
MRARYIARLAGAAQGHDDATERFAQQLGAASNAAVIRLGPLTIATLGPPPLRCGPHGVIIGSLYRRDGGPAVANLTDGEQQRIVASRGAALTDLFWGPYVALLANRDGTALDVIRAPLGELPCLHTIVGNATILASDVDLLRNPGGYRPEVDWDQVISHLAWRYVSGPRTCLIDLRELQGGNRLAVDGTSRHMEELWSPWRFASAAQQFFSPGDAEAQLRQAVLDCIASRAAPFEAGVVMLSGGLDSSLVAMGLKAAPIRPTALNLVTQDPGGDEVRYAAQVCESLGIPLTLGLREVARIDIHRSGAAGLPRPSVRGFLQESNRLVAEAAAAHGATAIFNGGGGDGIFCSLQSGAPVADRLLATGIGRGIFKTAFDMSELAQASIWSVLVDGIRRAWLGKPAYRQTPELDLLSSHIREQAAQLPGHPWMDIPPGMLPGKAMHVRMTTFAQSYVEGLDPRSTLPVIVPLLSQPLVEACLRVPSWYWLERGHNRMIARRAFAGRLPEAVLLRRSKAAPNSFLAEIIDHHRQAIRALIEEGELGRRGLIDVPSTLALIDQQNPLKGPAFERILEIIDVEVWARSWAEPQAG